MNNSIGHEVRNQIENKVPTVEVYLYPRFGICLDLIINTMKIHNSTSTLHSGNVTTVK